MDRSPAGGPVAVAILALAAACDTGPVTAPATPPSPLASGADCAAGAFVATVLYGGVEIDIEWRGDVLGCEGMPRPDGAGARLRFSGPAGDEHRLTIIIALPDLEPGAAAAELASNVTLIEEGTGRFYSTTGLDDCWTDVTEQSPLAGANDVYIVTGTLYCISPLGEVNGDASVSLAEMRFSGVIDWNAS